MKEFPTKLTPDNLTQFKEFQFKRQLCYLRRHVYETMLSDTFKVPENCSINLQGVIGDEYNVNQRMVVQIREELKILGWETSLSYGDTVLFIYSPGVQPANSVNCVGFE